MIKTAEEIAMRIVEELNSTLEKEAKEHSLKQDVATSGGALAGGLGGAALGGAAGSGAFKAYHKIKGTKVDKPFTAYRVGYKGPRGIPAMRHGLNHVGNTASGGLLGLIAGAAIGGALAHNALGKKD